MNRERQPQSNQIFWAIDTLKEKFSKKIFLKPELLHTNNRKDIDYRVLFLQDVLEKKLNPKQTKYYSFISDTDKGIIRNPDTASEDFLTLFFNIQKNNMLDPILAGKYNSSYIKTRYIFKKKKYWFEIKNQTGYQLMDGAHRLAIALYLKHKQIPVKVIKPMSFEIPNYTEYIKLKEKEYLDS